jgi:PAS domain S-box-containing protein
MTIPLTTRILGYLLERGYTHALAKLVEDDATTTIQITLYPIREKPELAHLPGGYETYYRLTQEPLQMACGIDNGTSVVIDLPLDDDFSDLQMEDALEDESFRLSEDFYKQVIESLEEYAVFATDKQGNVISWNKGAERLLGYSENEIIGSDSSIFFTEKDREAGEPEKELENAIEHGKAIDERYHLKKDQSVFWASGLVFPLLDTKGKHRGYTKIMRNLEEHRESAKHRPETHL